MSEKIFARFLAAAKVKTRNGYNWSLKNPTLASAGIMLGGTLAGTIGGTSIIVYDNRLGNRDVKNDADQKQLESRRYIDEKFAELKAENMETQRLVITCAASTMKGFQGDTAEIEQFVKSVEVFDKAIGCVKAGGC